MSENSTMYFILHKILHFEKLEDRIIDLEHKNVELQVNLKLLENKFENLTRSENGFELEQDLILGLPTEMHQKQTLEADKFPENSFMEEIENDVQKYPKLLVSNPDIVITNLDTNSCDTELSEYEGDNFENGENSALKNQLIDLNPIDNNLEENQQNSESEIKPMMVVNTVYNDANTIVDKLGKFKCKNCPETFKLSAKLFRHIDTVHKIKNTPFKCTICLKSYSTVWNLKDHQNRIHKDSKSKSKSFIICSVCPLKFSTSQALDKHSLIHNRVRVRPYICHICTKSYGYLQNLKRHIESHKETKTS